MRKKQTSDRELVRNFVEGDVSSFDTLINRYKDRVYTYIFAVVKNQELAEDIFQETFIKVIKSLRKKKYEERGTFLSWVLRIAHNDAHICISQIKILDQEITHIAQYDLSSICGHTRIIHIHVLVIVDRLAIHRVVLYYLRGKGIYISVKVYAIVDERVVIYLVATR
jgi:hypothetical protein